MESANGLINSSGSVKNSKQRPTLTVSSESCARLKASPTRSILEPLYPDKKLMGDKGRAEALKSWHSSQTSWLRSSYPSYPIHDCSSSQVELAECLWMDGSLIQPERSSIKNRRYPEAKKYNPDFQSGRWKSSILTLVNKTTSLLFRFHPSKRPILDESTAVIAGDQHK